MEAPFLFSSQLQMRSLTGAGYDVPVLERAEQHDARAWQWHWPVRTPRHGHAKTSSYMSCVGARSMPRNEQVAETSNQL
jgi:hypothetical protein